MFLCLVQFSVLEQYHLLAVHGHSLHCLVALLRVQRGQSFRFSPRAVGTPFGDEYVEVTTYTYTDIPLEGNFEYVQNFNWCGLNHINKISKGFNSKNHIKRIVNDHPLEDEYAYEKDNEGNIKLVTMSRCGDNYSQNVEIKAVIGK